MRIVVLTGGIGGARFLVGVRAHARARGHEPRKGHALAHAQAQRAEDRRPPARRRSAERLHGVHVGSGSRSVDGGRSFKPLDFKRSLTSVDRVSELPPDTRFFLVRAANEVSAETTTQFSPRYARPILRIEDYRKWKSILFAVEP